VLVAAGRPESQGRWPAVVEDPDPTTLTRAPATGRPSAELTIPSTLAMAEGGPSGP
jgi:hypothetical protein